MPRNLEIKARLAGLHEESRGLPRDSSLDSNPPLLRAARLVAARLATRAPVCEHQVDRYLQVAGPDGVERLKLRSIDGGPEVLIPYRRLETDGVRVSDYALLAPDDVRARALLAEQGEVLVTVEKRREVFLIDNVRVHLDEVEGLGTFLELEAMVDADHDEARCAESIAALLEAFGIGERDLLRASYAELLLARE